MSGRGTDFFISHAGRDTGWAEWLAWQLRKAGYSVELDVWDWAPGEDFVARMSAALEAADRVLAVCSEAYFASAFGGAELRAAFAQSPTAAGRIVPVLVEPVTLPPLYAPLIHLDLTGLNTIRYLQAHGGGSACQVVCEPLLDRWREVLGPDQPDTLTAASILTLVLYWLGEEEPARALGPDTLQRCRRALGPDHPITLYLTQVARIGGRQ